MLIGLTTLFANAFGSSANRFSGTEASTTEFYVLVAVLAFLTLWVLCQSAYWMRLKLASRRLAQQSCIRSRKRRIEREFQKREFKKATFQLKVCLLIFLFGSVYSVLCLTNLFSNNGEFFRSLVDSERVSVLIENTKANLFVETPEDAPKRKASVASDETFDELKRIVDRQATEIESLSNGAPLTSEKNLVENKSEVSTVEPKEENDYGFLPGGIYWIPNVDADEIQRELVSGSESEVARLSEAVSPGSVRARDLQAPSRLPSSVANNGTPVRDLRNQDEGVGASMQVRAVSAAQLDRAFFEAREDREAQRRLAEFFTPKTPLAPFPLTLEASYSKNRLVNYEEKIDDGTSIGLDEGLWSKKDSKHDEENGEKSILVRIDEESNRISSLVRACVLPIETRKTAPGSRVVEEETGCGFLTQYNGKTYVVTNNHVVDRALSSDAIKIFLPNNQTISPSKVFPCDDFDLAALEVSADSLPKDGSVTLCRFGDSDSVRVANSVFAIGNPFGLEKSLSYGHVSSLRRSNRDLVNTNQNLLPEYIQIDAAINPGNSGGPLYDSRGDVVGIVTAIATTSGKNEGVAFAIPINVALRVVKTTIDGGTWRRSRLGVELESATRADLTTTNLPYVFGAKIVEISSQSPAQTAGLKPGDVVLTFNGKQVENDVHLARLIALADASETARIGVLRGSNYFEVGAKLERDSTK